MLTGVVYNLIDQLVAWCLFLQMDAQSLAMEFAPLIIWQNGQKPEYYRQYWNDPSTSQNGTDTAPTYSAWDMLAGWQSDILCFCIDGFFCAEHVGSCTVDMMHNIVGSGIC